MEIIWLEFYWLTKKERKKPATGIIKGLACIILTVPHSVLDVLMLKFGEQQHGIHLVQYWLQENLNYLFVCAKKVWHWCHLVMYFMWEPQREKKKKLLIEVSKKETLIRVYNK